MNVVNCAYFVMLKQGDVTLDNAYDNLRSFLTFESIVSFRDALPAQSPAVRAL